jgi:hypothetical protein
MLDMNDPAECITIYGNGPIRKTVSGWAGRGNPHILKEFPEIRTLEDWTMRFLWMKLHSFWMSVMRRFGG